MNGTYEFLIRERTPEIVDQIKKAAQWAKSEADLQHEVDKTLDSFRMEAGIKKDQFDASHKNVTIGKSGRPDSRYQVFFIEYKSPVDDGYYKKKGSFNFNKALEQIQERFEDLEKGEKREREHIYGVGLDGHDFIFVRWQRNDWDVRFMKVNEVSIRHLLHKLIDLTAHGRSFTPEQLAGDFGSDSHIAEIAIRHFYEAIIHTQNPRALTFFEQWKILFGEVCGYDVTSLSDKLKKLAKFYLKREKCKPAELMFAVHTYFALFMKLLAGEIVSYFLNITRFSGSILKTLQSCETTIALKAKLEEIESGGIFKEFAHITNLLEGDLFAWYLDTWDEELKAEFGKVEIPGVVRDIVSKLDLYNLTTLSTEPEETRDLLKKLYQNLFPQSVRHDLGEYYTPDWLAEHVLNEVGYDGDPNKRVLDPACGSGTFLVLAINRILEHERECQRPWNADLLEKIVKNVIGFDLNPLAVMASRVNYLLALGPLLGQHTPFEIPVYLCDSILTPSEYGGELFKAGVGEANELKTAAFREENRKLPKDKHRHFLIPLEISKPREVIAKYADALEFCIQNDYSPDEFLEYCRKHKGLDSTKEELHEELYSDLRYLEQKGRNGVWARIIKNAYAPLFIERVDFVVGNPPWVNWESLPEDYREENKRLWESYGLLKTSKTKGAISESSMEFSVLYTYVCLDHYARLGGTLGFVISHTLFKAGDRGRGFRSMRLDDTRLRVLRLEYWDDTDPFPKAGNRPGAIYIRKGAELAFPIPTYTYSKRSSDVASTEDLAEDPSFSIPADSDEDSSPWMTVTGEYVKGVMKVFGGSSRTAQIGLDTMGANGVYWVSTIEEVGKKTFVKNAADAGNKEVPSVEALVDRDLLYPLVRGQNIEKYACSPEYGVIVPHSEVTGWRALPEHQMKLEFSDTYAFLKRFRSILATRPSYLSRRSQHPWYILFRIYEKYWTKYLIGWRRMANQLKCAFISRPESPCIPSDTVTWLAFDDPDTAYGYVAMLNSSPADLSVRSYSSVGRGFGGTHVMRRLRIVDQIVTPEVIRLSKNAHEIAPLAYAGEKKAQKELAEIEQAIDEAAADLWGITKKELRAIQKALKDMEKPKRKRR